MRKDQEPKISRSLGKELLGKKVGEEVSLQTPEGEISSVTILEILPEEQ